MTGIEEFVVTARDFGVAVSWCAIRYYGKDFKIHQPQGYWSKGLAYIFMVLGAYFLLYRIVIAIYEQRAGVFAETGALNDGLWSNIFYMFIVGLAALAATPLQGRWIIRRIGNSKRLRKIQKEVDYE